MELNITREFCIDDLLLRLSVTLTQVISIIVSLWNGLSVMPGILAIGKPREDDCKFEASLDYKERPCLRKQTDKRSQANKQIRIYVLTAIEEACDGACISGHCHVVCFSKHNLNDY